jgi:hypothetical protein
MLKLSGDHRVGSSSGLSKADIPATVGEEDGDLAMRCVLRDFTREGCRLLASDADSLNDDVIVMISGLQRHLPGRIVARGPGEVEIEFYRAAGSPDDTRKDPRKPASLTARASDPDSDVAIICTIVDASTNGCQIKSCDVAWLPDGIVLDVPKLNISVGGQIRWRSRDRAGIELDWTSGRKLREGA